MSDMPWHLLQTAAFRKLERAVEKAHPGLHFEDRANKLVLFGDLQLVDANRVIDLYEVEVDIPHGGPKADLPIVREVGGRIPWIPDRHVNFDGSACLTVPDAFWYRHPDGLELLEFLEGPVRGYFLGQSIVESGGDWPFGERAHGIYGVVEFYAKLIGTSDPVRIHAFLTDVIGEPLGNRPCACGSGHLAHGCHETIIRELRRIPRSVLITAAAMVRSVIPIQQQ
jgi:hypothetical protein